MGRRSTTNASAKPQISSNWSSLHVLAMFDEVEFSFFRHNTVLNVMVNPLGSGV